MYTIKNTTKLDIVFGPQNVYEFMPSYEELRQKTIPNFQMWKKLFNDWFFVGINDLKLTPQKGIDEKKALWHIKAIMTSFQPKHEHKKLGICFLLSEWFVSGEWSAGKNK